MAVSGSNIYIAFTIGTGEINLARSTDSGSTWKSIANLSNNPGNSFDPRIVASGSNVFVIWTQANSGGSSYDIFFRRSTDNGNAWKAKVNLSNDVDASAHGKIVTSGTSLHVIWDNGHYRRSTDNGATWKSVQNVDCASDISKISVAGNKVYVASPNSSRELLLCRSTDGGSSWKNTVTVFSVGQCYPQENFFDLAATGSRVFVTCNSEEFAPLNFKRSTDNGATWSAARQMFPTGMSFGHVLAVTDSTVFVVGTELIDTSNDDWGVLQEIFVRRSLDSGATWKSSINQQHS
jgi:photosystem II stability/assembly factor-like uncharacterized protein